MSYVVRCRNLGKAYKRYREPQQRLWEWLRLGWRPTHERVWALRGVSVEISPGEAVAVVGRNGAGKTTLLRLLRGVLVPTEGDVSLAGAPAAIDLGIGFHLDFTGRANLFAASSLMGLLPAELEELVPEISRFSELGDWLDQPVRTYSTGMRLRLAFSLATARRPPLLLIDEALMVGDIYFQQKCFARIREFQEAGTTLVFVSHDQASIRTLCQRALLLEDGLLVREGSPSSVLEYYNALIAKSSPEYDIQSEGTTRSGNGKARISRVLLMGAYEDRTTFHVAEEITVRIEGECLAEIDDITVGISIRDRLGNEMYATNTHLLDLDGGTVEGGGGFVAEFDLALNFGVGHYTITAAVHSGSTHIESNYDWWDNARAFQLLPGAGPAFAGACYIPVVGRLETSANSDGTTKLLPQSRSEDHVDEAQ